MSNKQHNSRLRAKYIALFRHLEQKKTDNSTTIEITIHTRTMIIDNDQLNMDTFCLSSETGNHLWSHYQVIDFIKDCPEYAFGVVSHCHVFSKFMDYAEYEQTYGFGSFHEELVNLSYDSPLIYLQICEEAMYYHQSNCYQWAYECQIPLITLCQIQQIDDSLTLQIPNELKTIIYQFLFHQSITDLHNSQKQDKIDESLQFSDEVIDTIDKCKMYETYCLNTSFGSNLWYKCDVFSFVNHNPRFVLKLMQRHQDTVLDLYNSDFYQDVVYLASDDPVSCLELCKYAHCNYQPGLDVWMRKLRSNDDHEPICNMEYFVMYETDIQVITKLNELIILFAPYLNIDNIVLMIMEYLCRTSYEENLPSHLHVGL